MSEQTFRAMIYPLRLHSGWQVIEEMSRMTTNRQIALGSPAG